jgi:hypothetical protein
LDVEAEESSNDTSSVFDFDSTNAVDATAGTTVIFAALPIHVTSLKRRFEDTEEDGSTDEVSRKRRHVNEVEELAIKSPRPRHQRRIIPYFNEYYERVKQNHRRMALLVDMNADDGERFPLRRGLLRS